MIMTADKANSRLTVLYYLWVASTIAISLVKASIPIQGLPHSLLFLIPTFTMFLYLYKRQAFFRKNAPAEIFNVFMWIFTVTLGASFALQIIELFLNGSRPLSKALVGLIVATVYVLIVKALIGRGFLRK